MSTKITVKMEKTSNSILFQVSSEKPLIREKTVKRPALTASQKFCWILISLEKQQQTNFLKLKYFISVQLQTLFSFGGKSYPILVFA